MFVTDTHSHVIQYSKGWTEACWVESLFSHTQNIYPLFNHQSCDLSKPSVQSTALYNTRLTYQKQKDDAHSSSSGGKRRFSVSTVWELERTTSSFFIIFIRGNSRVPVCFSRPAVAPSTMSQQRQTGETEPDCTRAHVTESRLLHNSVTSHLF